LYNIPVALSNVYKEEWVSEVDFFGWKQTVFSGEYRTYVEARKFVHSLNLKKSSDWSKYCDSGKKPDNIPVGVSGVYKNKGWVSWGDFLGTGAVSTHKRTHWSFERARAYVRKLNLKTRTEFSIFSKEGKLPAKIPVGVFGHYKDKGWISWGDFLGTGRVANQGREYKSFKEARAFVHTLKIQNWSEWKAFCKSGNKPDDIPGNPRRAYNNGWIDSKDWFGKE